MTRPYLSAAALVASVAGAICAWALAVHLWSLVPKRRKGW